MISAVNGGAQGDQLTAFDTINGGAGTDTFQVVLAAIFAGNANITNVEQIFTTGAFNFSTSGIAGLTDVKTQTAGGSFSALTNATNLNMIVQGSSTDATANTFTFSDSAVAGAANAGTLVLDRVASSLSTGQTTTVNINNTTAGLTGSFGLETLTVNLAGAAGSALLGGTATLATNSVTTTTINITGAGNGQLTLGANYNGTALTTINGSTSTGGFSITGIGATNLTATGGSGNDAFNFGANFDRFDVVNGGAGTDTLGANAAQLAAITTVALGANVTNIETLRIMDDAAADTTIDLANFGSGASNIRVAAQTGGQVITINNLAATAAVRLDGTTTAVTDLILNLVDATLPATANTINLDLRGGAVSYFFTSAGVETINIDSSLSTGATGNVAIVDGALKTLNVTNTSTNAFTMTMNAANTGVETVNMSGVTGAAATSVTMVAVSIVGTNYTGSANNDTFVATANIDVISSGAGDDTITGLGGADRINVGTGTDTVRYTVAGQTTELATPATLVSGVTSISATVDVLTGMGAGDIINLATIANTYTGAAATTIAGASGNTVAIVRGNYNATTGIWTTSSTGADSILAFDADAAASAATVTDFVVLVGFTGVSSTAAAGVITLA